MTGEITKELYCVTGCTQVSWGKASHCYAVDNGVCKYNNCPFKRHKWPTPEQLYEEYGEKVPQSMPVWVNHDIGLNDTAWELTQIEYLSADKKTYYGPIRSFKVNAVVVACTPWGKPPADWRPE